MSQENVELVRQPIAVAAHPRRRLEQHLIRFPPAFALFARAAWRFYTLLPPRSRLRQAIARRYVAQAAEALNRGDLEAAFAVYHPDVETIIDQRLVALGVEPTYRGRKARMAFQERWNTEWGEWRFEPEEVIDLGDGRMLAVGRVAGSGLSSGVALDRYSAFLVTFGPAGRVIREQVFLDRDEALEAVGLRE
ncbi:MAG: nuclear transport factor 2 family protein [Actinomycetota bacterium]|nr:nuclear transport factor 2 family protein [Actinomycetota bacterium]